MTLIKSVLNVETGEQTFVELTPEEEVELIESKRESVEAMIAAEKQPTVEERIAMLEKALLELK